MKFSTLMLRPFLTQRSLSLGLGPISSRQKQRRKKFKDELTADQERHARQPNQQLIPRQVVIQVPYLKYRAQNSCPEVRKY